MDFVILVDTREQMPLCFGALPTRAATLRTGDYSVEGCADTVAIERKSLPDLFSCIGQQRDRFERELERLAALRYGAIVVEATMADVLRGCPSSRIHPASAFGSLMSWSVQGRLPIFFCGNRELAARTVTKLLEKCAKHIAGEAVSVASERETR
jgi:ERCC4-type nuclease